MLVAFFWFLRFLASRGLTSSPCITVEPRVCLSTWAPVLADCALVLDACNPCISPTYRRYRYGSPVNPLTNAFWPARQKCPTSDAEQHCGQEAGAPPPPLLTKLTPDTTKFTFGREIHIWPLVMLLIIPGIGFSYFQSSSFGRLPRSLQDYRYCVSMWFGPQLLYPVALRVHHLVHVELALQETVGHWARTARTATPLTAAPDRVTFWPS